MAGYFLPSEVVTDAVTIERYYREHYGKRSTFIPYGADTGKLSTYAVLEQLGLEPGRYFLYVSRMEPENHPLEVREAFEQVSTPMKLALIGDAPYAEDYIRRVRQTADPRVVMPALSTAPAMASWARTASLTSMPPKWAARTRR